MNGSEYEPAPTESEPVEEPSGATVAAEPLPQRWPVVLQLDTV